MLSYSLIRGTVDVATSSLSAVSSDSTAFSPRGRHSSIGNLRILKYSYSHAMTVKNGHIVMNPNQHRSTMRQKTLKIPPITSLQEHTGWVDEGGAEFGSVSIEYGMQQWQTRRISCYIVASPFRKSELVMVRSHFLLPAIMWIIVQFSHSYI